MPDVRRTRRQGVFTNGTSFYVRPTNGKWVRFATFREAVAFQNQRAPLPPPRRRGPAPEQRRPGWIYFLSPIGGGLVKIGFSRVSPESRLSSLQCGSPVPLEIIGRRRGDIDDEHELHFRLAEFRRHGEWFEAAPEVLRQAALDDAEVAADEQQRRDAALAALRRRRP